MNGGIRMMGDAERVLLEEIAEMTRALNQEMADLNIRVSAISSRLDSLDGKPSPQDQQSVA